MFSINLLIRGLLARVASQKTNFASLKLKTRNQIEFLILFHVVNSDFRQNRFLPVLREDIGLAWCQWPADAENLYTGVFDHGDSESEKKFGGTSGNHRFTGSWRFRRLTEPSDPSFDAQSSTYIYKVILVFPKTG